MDKKAHWCRSEWDDVRCGGGAELAGHNPDCLYCISHILLCSPTIYLTPRSLSGCEPYREDTMRIFLMSSPTAIPSMAEDFNSNSASQIRNLSVVNMYLLIYNRGDNGNNFTINGNSLTKSIIGGVFLHLHNECGVTLSQH